MADLTQWERACTLPRLIKAYGLDAPVVRYAQDQPWTGSLDQVSQFLQGDDPTASEIETYLVPIETSVDSKLFGLWDAQAAYRRTIADAFRDGHTWAWANPRADRLAHCSTRWAVYTTEDGYEVHPYRCRDRACPTCQQLRSRTWFHTALRVGKLALAPKHIVLTLKSSDAPLGAQIDRLIHCARQLRQRDIWTDRTPWGIQTIEITYNEDTRQFHPHCHLLVNMRYLKWDLLRDNWMQITKDSWDCSIRAASEHWAAEVAKYVSKTTDIWAAPVDKPTLAAQLKGRRLVQRLGSWPEATKPEQRIISYVGSIRALAKRAAAGDRHAHAVLEWVRYNNPEALHELCITRADGAIGAAGPSRQARRGPPY